MPLPLYNMTKISLAINSKKPILQWLNQAITSGLSFDEIVIYIDAEKSFDSDISDHVKNVSDGKERDIKDGFNYVIGKTSGDWVCSFCDDDFFYENNLIELLNLIKDGWADECDIIHFPVTVNGCHMWGQNENFTLDQLINDCKLPHGSFFRRSVFNELGGYKINAGADWNFWIRAMKKGFKFKYFAKPIYNFRQGQDRSATTKQLRELGSFAEFKKEVLDNA